MPKYNNKQLKISVKTTKNIYFNDKNIFLDNYF